MHVGVIVNGQAQGFIPLGHNPMAVPVMEKGCAILDELGLKWWLSAGTILGIHRDGELIAHDTDIDVGCQDAVERFPELEDAFFDAGFAELRFHTHQRAFIYLGVVFDVYSFNRDGDELTAIVDTYLQSKPYRLFQCLGDVEFQGRRYPTPNPLDEYLEVRYGPEWRTPKTEKLPWIHDTFCVKEEL